MGFLGSVGKALGGKILDIGESAANAAMSYDANRRLQQKAFDWEKEKLQNAVQWRMSDLEKAGINPILAAQSGLPTGSTGGNVSFGSGHTNLSDYENAATAKKAQKAQEKLQEAEVIKAGADAKRAEAEQRAAEATATRIEAENATNAPRLKSEKEFFNSQVGNYLHKFGLGAKEVAPAISAVGGGLIGGAVIKGLKGFKSAHSAGRAANSIIKTDSKGRAYIPGGQINKATAEDWARLMPTKQRGFMRYPSDKGR